MAGQGRTEEGDKLRRHLKMPQETGREPEYVGADGKCLERLA